MTTEHENEKSEIADALVKEWNAADRMPQVSWGFREFAVEAMRRYDSLRHSQAGGAEWMRLARDLTKWRLCMSYNESYFEEPVGELKRIANGFGDLLFKAEQESKK